MLMEPQTKKQYATLKSFFTNDKQRYTFYFDLAPNAPPHKIDIYLQARTLTEDALLFAIEQLNKAIRKDNIQLLQDVRLYKARLVGRNFKPKTDLPCLSLYQKICDLKIDQIAVQIPNREKAIRPIQTQIQIPPQITLPIQPQPIQPQIKNAQQQFSLPLEVPREQVKFTLLKQQPNRQEQVQSRREQSKAGQVVVIDNAIKDEVVQQPIGMVGSTREESNFEKREVIEEIPVTNDESDEVREPSQQSKVKRQQQLILIPIQKEMQAIIENTVEPVKIQRIQEQPTRTLQQQRNVQGSRHVAKLLQQLIQERKELQVLRKEIAEQKKDIRQQRKDLREQRSEVRQMRKQISQQRARLQQEQKQLSELSRRLQQERKEWQQKISKIRKI